MRIRKNDNVKILSGKDKGKIGKVVKIYRNNDRALVQGVNYVYKHLRKSQDHPHGARIQKEAPIHVSNLMIVCPDCSKPSRVKMKMLENGSKTRICGKCQKPINVDED